MADHGSPSGVGGRIGLTLVERTVVLRPRSVSEVALSPGPTGPGPVTGEVGCPPGVPSGDRPSGHVVAGLRDGVPHEDRLGDPVR